MVEEEKKSARNLSGQRSVLILFSLLHIITIACCGFLLIDGVRMKDELEFYKSAFRELDLFKGGEADSSSPFRDPYKSSPAADHETRQTVTADKMRQTREVRSGVPGEGQIPCSCDCGGSRSNGNVRGPGSGISSTPNWRDSARERLRHISCKGSPGITGSPGPKGTKGNSGRQGENGLPGVVGPSGAKGDPGRQGENGLPGAGLPGAPGLHGQTGMPGSPGEHGRTGPPGSRGPSGIIGFPGLDAEGASEPDVTFIHWGKTGCTIGNHLYTGYAVGLNSGSPVCAPRPNEILSNSISLLHGPRLTALKYDLQEAPNQLNLATLNNKIVRCALCHAQRNEIFTVVGQTRCFSTRLWSTAYSGYLMAAESTDGSTSSEPICVDQVPDQPESLQTDTQTQGLRLVRSGRGVWSENKLVTCAVCIRNPVTKK